MAVDAAALRDSDSDAGEEKGRADRDRRRCAAATLTPWVCSHSFSKVIASFVAVL